ncbi:hypothetical protein C8R44DRAFT_847489 [Mycena epipterygia]|nr:hypothetical protein C8R44DRAFT_847489 [Mycena epipterygia]
MRIGETTGQLVYGGGAYATSALVCFRLMLGRFDNTISPFLSSLSSSVGLARRFPVDDDVLLVARLEQQSRARVWRRHSLRGPRTRALFVDDDQRALDDRRVHEHVLAQALAQAHALLAHVLHDLPDRVLQRAEPHGTAYAAAPVQRARLLVVHGGPQLVVRAVKRMHAAVRRRRHAEQRERPREGTLELRRVGERARGRVNDPARRRVGKHAWWRNDRARRRIQNRVGRRVDACGGELTPANGELPPANGCEFNRRSGNGELASGLSERATAQKAARRAALGAENAQALVGVAAADGERERSGLDDGQRRDFDLGVLGVVVGVPGGGGFDAGVCVGGGEAALHAGEHERKGRGDDAVEGGKDAVVDNADDREDDVAEGKNAIDADENADSTFVSATGSAYRRVSSTSASASAGEEEGDSTDTI